MSGKTPTDQSGGLREGLNLWETTKDMLLAGESLLVDGVPGAGKTTLARELAIAALGEVRDDFWAPVLVITPDRRRAASMDLEIARQLPSGNDGLFRAPGSHRLIRSLNSYAHLVDGLWRVERETPLPRLPFTSGAREDAWLQGFLQKASDRWEPVYGNAVMASPAMRMEIRNVIARSGEVGLEAEDLAWLGDQFDRPLWRLAAEAYLEYAGPGQTPFGANTPHVDSARLPRIAAHVLSAWEGEADSAGITAPLPVPRVLIVDDVQDMPASATPLIIEAAKRAEQVVLLSSPLSATADFRGGRPDLGNEIAQLLQLRSVHLTTNLRADQGVAAAGYQVGSWLQPAEVAKSGVDGSAYGSAPGVEASLVATETKRDTLIAQTLRRHHLEDGVPWENMAVVVRGASVIEPLRRRLMQLGVPLAPLNRPVQLAKAPMCAALLEVLALGGLEQGLPGPDSLEMSEFVSEPASVDREELQQAAADLVSSPLVNADPMALFRLIRALRASDSSGRMIQAGTLDLLEIPEEEFEQFDVPDDKSRGDVLRAVRNARKIWRARKDAAASPAQTGLWMLWDAADIEQTLRRRATDTSPRKAVSREIAADALDSVIALFRKADLWQQEKLEVFADSDREDTAFEFAVETLGQSVSTDSLVKGGLAEPGVSIATVSQAAGSEWDVVCVVGPQLGSWPSTAVDSMAQLSRLRLIVDDATSRGWGGETPIRDYLPDLDVGLASNYRQARIERTRNDAQLFLSAVTRAKMALHFFAVESEDQGPSPFLTALSETGIVAALQDEEGFPRLRDPEQDLDLASLVAALRRRLVSPSSSSSKRKEAARILALLSLEGVPGASPETWTGVGSVSTDAPVIDAGPIALSPSALELMDECQLRWFFRFSRGQDQDTGEEAEGFTPAALGTLIHAIAEAHPRGPSGVLHQELDERWPSLGLSDDTHWGRFWKTRAENMVDRLAEHLTTWKGPVEVEESFEFQVGPGVVRGRIDRLEIEPDGSARIIDIKSGRPLSRPQVEKNPQLRAYQSALQALGYKSAGAGLLQVAAEKPPALTMQEALSEEAIEEHLEVLSQAAEDASGATFRAEAGWHCGMCEFTKACPAVDGKKGERDV